MNTTQHLEPVPEINEISILLSEKYDAPHMTLYYETGLSEPEEDSDLWEYRELKGKQVDEALSGFITFLKASLKEFEIDRDARIVAKVKAYLETVPKIEATLRTFVAPANKVLRQVSEFDDESVEGMNTYYFLVNGKWFYLSYGRIDAAEE
jgi:hypothetical protein